MGIKNLSKFLKKNAPRGIRMVNISEYAGRRVAIDISTYIYKALYNSDNEDYPHLVYLFNQATMLMSVGVIPVYVFDGKPPDEKNGVLKTRSDKKKALETRISNLQEEILKKESRPIVEGDDEVSGELPSDESLDSGDEKKAEIKQLSKSLIRVTEDHIIQIKELLSALGVMYVQGNGEAESICAKMYKLGLVDLCITEDTDILPFGSGISLRAMNNKGNSVMEYNLSVILDELELTYKQFVEFCILCGCDYTCTITQVGPATAYKFIKQYGSIRKLIKKEIKMKKVSKYSVPVEFDYKTARRLFMHPGEGTDVEGLVVKLQGINDGKLYKLMCSHPLVMKRVNVDKKLDKCRKQVSKGKKSVASVPVGLGAMDAFLGK